MSVRSLKGEKSGQWKWALHWIQALFWGYYCFWLSLEIGWLLFIPVGGLQPNLWPKLSQRTGKHKLKIVAILFKFNTEIVRNLITAERLQFSNLPFQRERDWKKTLRHFNSDLNAASPERPQKVGGRSAHFYYFAVSQKDDFGNLCFSDQKALWRHQEAWYPVTETTPTAEAQVCLNGLQPQGLGNLGLGAYLKCKRCQPLV